MTPLLAADIRRDEGERLTAYRDTLGIWTIGVGHAYVQPGTVWTREQSAAQLAKDIASKVADLDKALHWWRGLNDARQDVLVNLCFNMGVNRLLGFKNTLAAVKAGRWRDAHDGMLNSKWADQVHGRAYRLATQMLTGVRA